MAAITLLKRASGKAHLQNVLEGTDDAVIDSIITSGVTTADLYNDANTQVVNVGGSALTTANLATGAAVTAVNIGTGMGAGDLIGIGGSGSTVTVGGDLVVNGTTTTINSEVVNIADNHLYLNADYTTAVAQTGGLVVNYLPTGTADTEAAGGFTSATTVATTGAAVFAAGDFVQVSGASNQANDGIYEVLTHAANVLTIDSTPVHSFSQTQFTVDATGSTAAMTKVTVSAIQAGADGIWETGSGSTAAGLTFSDLAIGSGNSLQAAYVQGNTISMSDAEGNFDVSVGSGTPAISLDAAGTSNFTVAGAGLTLSTTTSGTVLVSSAGLLDMDAAANMDIDVTGTFDMLSSSSFSIDGTGASNVTTATGDMTLSATAGSVVVSGGEAVADAVQITAGNAAGGVTASAGTGGYSIGSADTAAQTNSLFTGGTGAKANTIGSTASTSSLTLQSGTGGIDIGNGTAAMTVNVGTGGTGAKTVNIGDESVAASTVTLESGSTGDITFDARGITSPLTFNDASNINPVTLLAGETSILGMLNFLAGGGANENALVETFNTTNRAVGEPVIMSGDNAADTAADASAIATMEGFVGIVLTVGASGTVVTSGSAVCQFIAGLTAGTYPTAGDPVYISLTTGRVTTDASVFSPPNDVVYQIGIMKDASTLTATTTVDGDLGEITLQPKVLIEL